MIRMDLHILIAEGQGVLRKGLCTIFERSKFAVSLYEAVSEQELRVQLCQRVFDLVVVNQEFISDMKILPARRFVVLAAKLDMAILKGAYMQGALGYLSSGITAEMLLEVLDSTEKSFLIEPSFTPVLIEHIFEVRNAFIQEELLTPREREVICLLRQGLDRSSIARRLSIAETTLKTHIKNIARKSNEDQPSRISNTRRKSW
jgi:DNA-binding NarL/FixJ family response regulator